MRFIRTSVLIFSTLTFVAGIWALTPPSYDTKIHYTLSFLIDGKQVVTHYKDRIQKANGDWKEVTTYLNKDGSIDTKTTEVALNGRGVFKFRDNSHQLEFVGDRPAGYRPPKPANGEETTVAGEHVFKQPYARDGFIYLNDDGIMLKIEDDGMIFEAQTVEHGKFERIDDLPDWPISYDGYKRKVEKFKPVNAAAANRMDKDLPK